MTTRKDMEQVQKWLRRMKELNISDDELSILAKWIYYVYNWPVNNTVQILRPPE